MSDSDTLARRKHRTPDLEEFERLIAEMKRKGPAQDVPVSQRATQQMSSLSASVTRHLEHYFDMHGESLPPTGLYERILMEIERPLIELSLEACAFNQLRAAELLGLNRNTLRKKMKLLGIQSRGGER